MDTGSILYEVDGLDKELTRLRKRTTELNKRKKELIAKAIDLMRESGETSITHQGKTYLLDERSRHTRKTDKKKKQDALLVLQEEGFHGDDAEEMYNKLTVALQGPETLSYTLKK